MATEKRLLVSVYLVYYLSLALLLATSFFPDQRVWGLNFWAFLNSAEKYYFLGVGIIAPFLFEYISRAFSDRFQSERSFWIVGLLITAGFGLIFFFLRASTFFLGDGYTVVASLYGEIVTIKNRSLGENLIHLWLSELLGGRTQDNIYHSFLIGSIGSGVVYLLFGMYVAKKIYADINHRLIFIFGLLTAGGMLLWFGYIEFYSIFVLSVALFTGAGILITNGQLNRWVILPLLAFSVFLHIFGVILLPAMVYLLIYDSPLAKKISALDNKLKAGLVVVLLIVGILVFRYYYINDYFLQFAIMPLANSKFIVEGYSLFSADHILDYLNLILMFVPGIIIFAIAVLLNPLRGFLKKYENRFLLVLLASAFSAVFIFDPKIGMPRDWDLFSFASIPLTFAVFRWLIANKKPSPIRLKTAGLVIALGLLVLFSRVTVLFDKEAGVAQFQSYSRLDMIKNKNARVILINYLRDDHQPERSDMELKKWREDFAYTEAVYKMVVQSNPAENRRSIDQAYSTLKIEPTNWNAWTNMGVIYTELGNYDSALVCLRIADGLNPYSSIIYDHLATVYYRKHNNELAKKFWDQSLDRDSTNLSALIGYTHFCKGQNDNQNFKRYLRKVGDHPQAPDQYLAAFYRMYQNSGDMNQAQIFYRRLLARGYDSTKINTMAESVSLQSLGF